MQHYLFLHWRIAKYYCTAEYEWEGTTCMKNCHENQLKPCSLSICKKALCSNVDFQQRTLVWCLCGRTISVPVYNNWANVLCWKHVIKIFMQVTKQLRYILPNILCLLNIATDCHCVHAAKRFSVIFADFLFVLLLEFACRSTEATFNIRQVVTCWLMFLFCFVTLVIWRVLKS